MFDEKNDLMIGDEENVVADVVAPLVWMMIFADYGSGRQQLLPNVFKQRRRIF